MTISTFYKYLLTFSLLILLVFLLNLIPTSHKKNDSQELKVHSPTFDRLLLTDSLFYHKILELVPKYKLNWVNENYQKAEKSLHNQEKLELYTKLANYFLDSLQAIFPNYFFMSKLAYYSSDETLQKKYINLFLANLTNMVEPELINWFSLKCLSIISQVKTITDSILVAKESCYVLGNLSNNPMASIQKIQNFAEKSPPNLLANYILGVAGKKTGQFSKSIKRFFVILPYEPKNITLKLNIAECFELNKQYDSAILFYSLCQNETKNKELIADLTKRINILKLNIKN